MRMAWAWNSATPARTSANRMNSTGGTRAKDAAPQVAAGRIVGGAAGPVDRGVPSRLRPCVGAVLPASPQSRACRWQPACLGCASDARRGAFPSITDPKTVPHALLVDDDA